MLSCIVVNHVYISNLRNVIYIDSVCIHTKHLIEKHFNFNAIVIYLPQIIILLR